MENNPFNNDNNNNNFAGNDGNSQSPQNYNDTSFPVQPNEAASQGQPFQQMPQPNMQLAQNQQSTQVMNPTQSNYQPNMQAGGSMPQNESQPISPVPNGTAPEPVLSNRPIKPRGPWMIIAIIFIILSLIFAGAFAWAFMQYLDFRDNTNYKISQAVADNQKKVSLDLEKRFKEEAKSPYSLFVGPDDYGRVSFEYPKTWSVFTQSEVSSGASKPFLAFFYPDVVPPVTKTQQFALRMTIEDMDYDTAVGRYANQVKKGELASSPVQVGLLNGTRLDGLFTDDIRGSAVLFKVRDKTLTLRTDSKAFMEDFDKLIKTIQVTE